MTSRDGNCSYTVEPKEFGMHQLYVWWLRTISASTRIALVYNLGISSCTAATVDDGISIGIFGG